ncbi:protein FAR1-RELATED SEQUENCE 6-like [Triticum dicoccoides]|uniref:protein FAR1-RELATED SEQUENCE 6-like n=1 Tax=Triticum dicoccoides TaxID=85692 RepID=UPI0018913050|nr:protein FAR1-RELATED SEQUENCE 6-like [Triticum dicoccoides]XP_044391629.1 protein FAR1-RELATED SEQUENCE 6-like [Triticum aestivum]
MADLIPGEGELAFGGNQDDDDAEDASPGSKELAAMVEAAAAASVELDAAADRAPPYGDDRTPRDGMVFKSYEEVLNFYKRYALRTGFGVCVKKSSFTKAGLCRRLLLVCNRWGNGKEDACYQARPTAKTNCQATVVARLWGDGMLHLTDVSLEHNHPLNPSAARFLRCYKTLPSGMSKDLVVRAARGECATSGGDVEAPPMFDDWGRLKIRDGDVQAINCFFAEMQAKQPNFFYVMDFYVEGHLRSVLWADSRSREAYQYFSDAIWVDTTCLRSKFNVPLVLFLGVNHHGQLVLLGCGLLSDESTESLLWLFKAWLTCMKGRLPGAMITDESVAIKAAVREVFPKTRHRISDWHIVRSIAEKLGELPEYESIKVQMEAVIYGSLKDDQFETRWKNLINRFSLQDNEWVIFLYENRHLWVPSFLKDAFWAGLSVNHRESPGAFFDGSVSHETTLVSFLSNYMILVQYKYKMEQQDDFESLTSGRVLVSKFPMEEQISKLYTMNMFVKFQDELKSTLDCQVQQVSPSSFVVIDLAEQGTGLVTRKYEVVHCMETNRMECNCGLFQFSGIVCRHALSVLKWQQVYDIPPCYVLNRWRSDFKQLHALDNPLKDPLVASNHVERYDHISLQCLRLVEIGMVSDDKYQHALKLISDMKRTLLDDNLCRELEQKMSPPERAVVVNGDSHAQPGSSEGGPAKKRRGRPPKRSKEISVESVSNQCGNKESLLVSSDVSQKGALHSSSTASNLGTHVRAHGVDDLMEEVNANEVSFESRYGVQSSHPNHYGDQLHPGHTLQFGQHMPSAEQSRGVEWVYPTIYQDDQVPYGRRTS